MTKDGLKLLTIEPEDMFGELSLLYNCTHTYSVSGITVFLVLYLHADISGVALHRTFTLIRFVTGRRISLFEILGSTKASNSFLRDVRN